MSMDLMDQPNPDEAEFERPKDEYGFYYKAFKLEEKKMIQHQRFEEITTKYWQLLRSCPNCDFNNVSIPYSLYTQLMSRVYKVLLPLYRPVEMASEISQEWLMDCRGQSELSFQLFTKLLFRIAHQWCTHVDLDEYIDFLEKVYNRIIKKELYSQSLQVHTIYPVIQVEFPHEEKRLVELGENYSREEQLDDWLECRSNESEISDYMYEYRENQEQMVTKKFKKLKQGIGLSGEAQKKIKDPFAYSEEALFDHKDLNIRAQEHDITRDVLNDLEEIYPFGYATEQFLKSVKNSVSEYVEAWKENNKKSKAEKTNLDFDNYGVEQQIPLEADPELVEEKMKPKELEFEFEPLQDDCDKTRVKAKVTDKIYNQIRLILREGTSLQLRLHSNFPKATSKGKQRTSMHSFEPITEVNNFGYNPTLERRVLFKTFNSRYININYMIDKQSNQLAYRADVGRIETKDKMAIKEPDQKLEDEDFVNVETSFKKARQVMLQKKFESIYKDRVKADVREQKRLRTTINHEENRKDTVMKKLSVQYKGMAETYEEKTFIKIMKGPFYNLDSLGGIKEDDFLVTSEYDLIQASRVPQMKLLVIGKPRSGKSTLSSNLTKSLDIVHINIENWILALLEKIKNYEPPEVEEGEEPPPFLTDLEEKVNTLLKTGQNIPDETNIDILMQQIHSPLARMKGYILDLTFYQRDETWAHTIKHKQMLGLQKDGSVETFTHVIELLTDDEEIKLRAQHLRVNPENGKLYSRWEREELRKPKPVSEDEEEPPEDDENAPKPLDENLLIQRTNDEEDQITDELTYYNTVERAGMEELMINLYDTQYIKVDAAGLTPDEITEQVTFKIKPEQALPLRPLALVIEGAGDFKGLLTEGLEENQIPRKWSLWKQIDPVALSSGQVMTGSPEFAASYFNNVFVFVSEENLKQFVQEPNLYLQHGAPFMPISYRVLMLGPSGVGKHTQAKLLSDLYGWKIVDYKQLVQQKLQELQKREYHVPNNPVGGEIGLAENELNEIIEGKPFPSWKFIPWIFDYLGYDLMKKKPPPPEPKPEGEEEAEEEIDEETKKKRDIEAKKKRDEEERKRKEEEEIQRQKEERRKKREELRAQDLDPVEHGIEDSEEEPIIIDDLPIDDLVVKEDEETGQQPTVGGFILIGFPETEEHINKLKDHKIEFDRIIYLNDTNEEEPGAEIKKRMAKTELYDWDAELEASQKVLGLAKEHLNEDNVREISCNGTEDDVLIRIRNEIDPFYLKVDNPDDVRVSADLGEEDKKLPKGDFGDYCPVTFVKDNWMIRGNPEQEVTIYGKTYWLAGEKEAEEFKFNPNKFMITKDGRANLPLQPPPPKVMILGMKGSGVTTQVQMLCDKYKLEEFQLKERYLERLKEEKEKRKRKRLLDRGFRPPQPVEEEGEAPPPDPEIEDDPDDFDKEGHEREVMREIFDASQGYVIDGTWADLPEESGIGQPLQDLLFESRRVPEIVIILKCKEQSTFKRMIDEESIKAEYERLMEVRAENKRKQREEDRAAKLEELKGDEEKTPEDIEEEMNKWDEDREAQEEADDEGDPEKPNLEEMMEKYRTDLRERREKDEAFIEEFSNALKEKNVNVIDDIKTDISADFVFIKILDRISQNFLQRKDLIEKQQAQPLKEEEVPFYEKSYIYTHSKFGTNSPLLLSNPQKTKKYSVLYRERLYFPASEEEQQQFLNQPSKFTLNVESIPLDIQIRPKVVVLGVSKSGKTTLSKIIAQKINAVHLKMSKIIDFFCDKSRDSIELITLRQQVKHSGKQIDDEAMINLLLKRIQYKDCLTNGWVLEDFPKTRNQAIQMARKGLVPSNVFYLRSDLKKTFERAQDSFKFGHQEAIISSRIKFQMEKLPHIYSFYQRYYSNVVEIDTSKSKWFMEDKALTAIQGYLKARQDFARDYYMKEYELRGCKMENLGVDRNLLRQSLSQFKFYCPVTWKNEKLLVKSHENIRSCVYYQGSFYYFRSNKERDMFLTNPTRFLASTSFPNQEDLPLRLLPHKAAEIISLEKALQGYCSVTLNDEERVVLGDPVLLVQYKDGKFSFESEYKLQRFYVNPFKYYKVQLPVKMPAEEDKATLYNLSKMEDSISFMEQALGSIVTKALREVSDNRLKYPTLSLKETMLKLFALYLKTENPANTAYMKSKYAEKMREFIKRCELPEEIYDLSEEKKKSLPKNKWPEFKENYYNEVGSQYDKVLKQIENEKQDGFTNYIR